MPESYVANYIYCRQGIPIDIGINLYKTLIRPHMQYALPVWANISDKDLVILENAQTHCIRRIVGAKAHSSTAAVEVITGIPPFRLRRRELCCREFIRIMSLGESHSLVRMLNVSTRSGLRFCPLEYIRIVGRELDKELSDCNIVKPGNISPVFDVSDTEDCISSFKIFDSSDCQGKGSASYEDLTHHQDAVRQFVQLHQVASVLVFTDGWLRL